MSAVYQVIISFVLLVTVSAYTANLAAFLTVSAKDVSSVTSLRQLIYEDRAACVAHDSAMRPTYEAVYPHMRKDLSHGQYEILDALRDKKCDAVVMARDLYDLYKMDTRYCHLSVIETLFPARLGWAVHRLSPCVKEAFEWAMDELWNEGKGASTRGSQTLRDVTLGRLKSANPGAPDPRWCSHARSHVTEVFDSHAGSRTSLREVVPNSVVRGRARRYCHCRRGFRQP